MLVLKMHLHFHAHVCHHSQHMTDVHRQDIGAGHVSGDSHDQVEIHKHSHSSLLVFLSHALVQKDRRTHTLAQMLAALTMGKRLSAFLATVIER